MPALRIGRLVLLALGALGIGAVNAPMARADEPVQSAVSVVLENDIISDTDQHYTNGIRFSGEVGLNEVPAWLLDAARGALFLPEDAPMRVRLGVGQSMYTPPNINLDNPPLDERPYAGWLYGSVGLVAVTNSGLDQLELSVGGVVPASLAA